MLERAKSCLKSEAARQPLKLGHRVSRSKRMLHSMFWNHGGGDLDVTPWAVSMPPIPSDLPLQHNNVRRGRQKTERSIQTDYLRNSSAAFEGVFLDFLYPPQAPAWLQRAHAQQWQRWERRNARRLPDGFVVAARGYASQPNAHGSSAVASNAGEDSKENEFDLKHKIVTKESDMSERSDCEATGEAGNTLEAAPEEAAVQSSHGTVEGDLIKECGTHPQEKSMSHDESVNAGIDVATVLDAHAGKPDEPLFRDLPQDISEYTASSPVVGKLPQSNTHDGDGVQRLRNIMSTSRSGHAKNSLDLTVRAINVYDNLDKTSKSDNRLKRELLEWLGMQQNDTARSKLTTLYKTIPVGHRSLQTYQTILSLAMEQNNLSWFAATHNEALQNLENGYQISRTMFRRAVEHRRWSIAMQIEEAHDEWYRNPSQSKLFWIHVSEIPQLLQKAIDLYKHLPTLEKSSDRPENLRRCALNFFREAVTQEFLRRDGNASFRDSQKNSPLPRYYIRGVFRYLTQHDEHNVPLIKEILLEMVRKDSGFDYRQLHEVVSFVYQRYIAMPTVRPSQELLALWLDRLTEYYAVVRVISRRNSGNRGHTSNSVSIPDLVRDWRKYHEHLPKKAVKRLMTYYARSGRLDLYEPWLEYLRSNYPNYEDQQDILWTMIWIHARRANLDRAQQAFAEVKRIMSENGQQPDIRCWNMLLHAHARVDDLEGAFTNLQNLLEYGGVKPDERTFHGIMEMLAKRGDVEGVENLLLQYDHLVGRKRNTAHLSSLILAHVNNDDVQTAEATLREAVPRVRRGEIHGQLLWCFNIVLTAHAMFRNISDTMRIYQWIKQEDLTLDGNSYAAVMQALVFYRRTQEAHGIITKIMLRNSVQPTAFHYAILIAGYVNNDQPQKALHAYDEMLKKRIRPNLSARSAYLKAKAISEQQRLRWRKVDRNDPVFLQETMNEVRRFLRRSSGAELASKDPGLGFGTGTVDLADAIPATYIDFLITIHGYEQCLKAVVQLHQDYLEYSKKHEQDPGAAPIKLLGSFAAASWRARRYGDVAKCWLLAKQQADKKAYQIRLPLLQMARDRKSVEGAVSEPMVSEYIPMQTSESRAEPKSERPAFESTDHRSQNLVPADLPPGPRAIAPTRRHILTRVLRYYILSLQCQGRSGDAISTVIRVIKQGYTMDNVTWNTFIDSLCQSSPPLALLAYVLTERFLTPSFPGWASVVQYPPKRQAVKEGLQYIKARYLAPGQLMPQYKTLVRLGGALLQLRRSLALSGGKLDNNLAPEIKKYVGTLDLIRRHAPKTLFIVQSMPRVPDKIQTSILGVENL